jgi:CHAT domain-containing protein
MMSEPDRDYSEGIETLSKSLVENRSGRRNLGRRAASRSRGLLERSGNQAGALRARLEQVYALSRSFQPGECLREAGLLAQDPHMPRYKWAWAQLHLERSMCAARLGDFESAARFMQIALRTSSESGYSTLHLRALGLNASLQTTMGNIPASWRENWNGIALFWKGTHPPMRAYQFYSELSHAAERDQRWHLGHLIASEAVSMSVLTGHQLMEAMARYRLAMFAGEIGRRDETLLELNRAAQLLAQSQDEPSIRVYSAESAIAVSNAYLETDDVDSAEKLIRSVNLKPDFNGSFLIRFAYHRTLGLIHYRRGKVAEADQALWKAIKLAEHAVQSIESARERSAWKRETAAAYRTLVRIALEGERPQDAFYIWEQYRSVVLQTATVRAASIKAAEPANAPASHKSSSVLSYAQFHDGVAAWLFDDRGLEFHWINIDQQRLDRMCANYLKLCSRRTSDREELTRASRELYDLLIRPFADKLQPGRLLLIEPDGSIGAVAFEALIDNSGNWLADRFEIVTSPGLWTEMKLRPNQGITPELQAVAVWNPTLAEELAETYPPLPDAEAEADSVAKHFRSCKLLTGANATVATVRESLSRAQVFHFAGHGIATSESGGLLLADSTWGHEAVLGSALLAKGPSRCRLAVLSACSTASGVAHGAGNPDSLVQAFWRAGVSNVIASRWDVDSGHAAAFFARFYDALAREQVVNSALARTAADFRRQPATSHPYFWTAFHVFGCVNPRRR